MKQIEPKVRKPRGKKSFPIVGIGASAGGLEAIEIFFAHMPTGVGMAFVVIQHLSPQHKSILGDILKKDTSMKVIEVQDGMSIVPNCIYCPLRGMGEKPSPSGEDFSRLAVPWKTTARPRIPFTI